MTVAALATAAAAILGTADFLGGLAARRSRLIAVVLVSQLGGLLVTGLLLSLLPGTPSAPALLWGMASGVTGATAIALFYRSLAAGVMSVVAPATGATSMAVPVLIGLALGERPSPLAIGGIAAGLAAVLLVGQDGRRSRTGSLTGPLVGGILAGAGFGGSYTLLKLAPADAGLWPLLGGRACSVLLVALVAVAARRSPRPAPGSLAVTLLAGVLDATGIALYLLAVQQGMLSLVAPLVSLYPASTLLLARYVLGERLRPVQITGVACALGAIVLISVS
ncbi:multidrug transporter [Thermobispora bispora]|uniref:EamA domain-containing protein n=1 Tax=Thermobispora bispora (strain ATCC 19993 / DSM 43833 / CBS 139.67 / JCM 10125 / KCTC 9307 / NBRC 14880 / R51) TaxID=469371 RepID=D6Y654_THEBD|nr:DMT family transporter [Thermobispora bispora]ADG89470.1 protein of unknown function DUF6 transmembrane [Thermobispora bispora DSM 43833]